MSPQLIATLSIIGLSLVGVLGDFFIKLSGTGEKYIEIKLFILGFLIYASTAIGWFFAMKYVKLSSLGMIYGVSTVVTLTLIGSFYFKEQLQFYELAALVMGIVSIILLSRFA